MVRSLGVMLCGQVAGLGRVVQWPSRGNESRDFKVDAGVSQADVEERKNVLVWGTPEQRAKGRHAERA